MLGANHLSTPRPSSQFERESNNLDYKASRDIKLSKGSDRQIYKGGGSRRFVLKNTIIYPASAIIIKIINNKILSFKFFLLAALFIQAGCNKSDSASLRVIKTSVFTAYGNAPLGLSSAKSTADNGVIITGNNDKGVGWAALVDNNNNLRWSYPSNMFSSNHSLGVHSYDWRPNKYKLSYIDSFQAKDGTFYICGNLESDPPYQGYGSIIHLDSNGRVIDNYKVLPSNLNWSNLTTIGACNISGDKVLIAGGALGRAQSAFWTEVFDLNSLSLHQNHNGSIYLYNNKNAESHKENGYKPAFMPWAAKMTILPLDNKFILFMSDGKFTKIFSWSIQGKILGSVQYTCPSNILGEQGSSDFIYVYTSINCNYYGAAINKYDTNLSLINSRFFTKHIISNVAGGFLLSDKSLFLYGGRGSSGYGLPFIASHIDPASGDSKIIKPEIANKKIPTFIAVAARIKKTDRYLLIFPFEDNYLLSSVENHPVSRNVGIASMSLDLHKE